MSAKKIVFALCVTLVTASPAFAFDMQAAKAADRYIAVADIDKSLDDSFKALENNAELGLTPEDIAIVKKSIDRNQFKVSIRNAMMDVFTVKEMDAMTAFYGTPEGRAIQKKMPVYMSKIMPLMQQTMMNALQLYTAAEKAKQDAAKNAEAQPAE